MRDEQINNSINNARLTGILFGKKTFRPLSQNIYQLNSMQSRNLNIFQ